MTIRASSRLTSSRLTLFVVALGVPTLALAAEGPVTGEVRGYIEHRHQIAIGLDPALASLPLVDFDEIGLHPDEVFGVTNHIRPTGKLHFGETATLVMTVDAHSYHLLDARKQEDLWDYLSLDRLYVSITTDQVDLTLGKQVLNWGHGLLLNPSAPNNERPPQDLRAELEGLWAARALVAIQDDANVTMAVAVRESTPDDPLVVGRWDKTLETTDMAVTVTWDEGAGDVTLGYEIKGDIEDGPGLWAETTASVFTDDASTWSFEVEAGLDYTFDVLQGLYVAAEYIHHGAGVDGDYIESALGGRRRSVLLGKDYALVMIRQTFDALWQAQLLSITNVRDPSGLVSAQLTWLPLGYLEIIFGANLTWGSGGGEYALEVPETVSMNGATIPIPEVWAGLPLTPTATLYLWARYYF